MTKRLILLSTTAAILCLPLAAQAQAQVPAPSPASTPATSDQDAASEVDEIVVTAQRREQRLVDVPASVALIRTEALQNAALGTTLQLSQATPGLTMYKTGAYTQPTMRGVGTSVLGPGADANVSLYIDGFYLPSQIGNNFDLNNIDSIEVLKGPQGTLFGRNATGGAILIHTRTPSFTPSADASVSYESYNDRRANLYVTGGLSSVIAADLAVFARRSDGWVKDIYTGEDWAPIESTLIRSRILFQPNDTFRAIVGLEHNEVSDGNNNVGVFINGRWRALRPDLEHADGPFEASQTIKPRNSAEVNAINLTTTTALGGWGELKTYSQYRNEESHNDADVDGSPLPLFVAINEGHEKTQTHEVTLGGDTDRLNWLAGVYFYDDDFTSPEYTNISSSNGTTLTTSIVYTNVHTRAYAGFLDGTYKLTDRLSLTLGGRYSWEEKELLGRRPPSAPTPTVDVSNDWKSFTPRVVLAYKLDEHSNVYASYTQGFKSGNYNANALDPIPVNPEDIDAYEIGFKTGTSRILFSSSAFYYKWTNLQLTSYDYLVSRSRLLNAAGAEIYGAEFDLSGNITDALTGRLAVTYTHAEYSDFKNAVVFVPTGDDIGNTQIIADRTGYRLQRTPEFQVSGQLTYTQPLARGELKWSGNVAYQTETNLNGYRTTQPAYALLNGSLTWTSPDERYDLSVYARNIADERYLIQINETGLGDNLIWGPPRTIGARVGVHF